MTYVVELREVDGTQAAIAGGKGAQLGELARIEGVAVPDGFCVTTAGFERFVAQVPSADEWGDRLSALQPDDRTAIGALAAEIRRTLEATAVPEDVATAVRRSLARLGEDGAYAVRSSATAEDLPTASSAGQQDTYLNVVGTEAVLDHVRRCWASLFTERAVTYRLRTGVDHATVAMAVVVQRMVAAQAAGVLFTADPVTSDRRVASVEAGFGLGEALVSGLVTPDVYRVRDGEVVARTVATKPLAIRASPAGGTVPEDVEPVRQDQPALTDADVLELVDLGRRIEAHAGRPQDIEWCLGDDGFEIVQSRPITTLFPIPAATDDGPHVYISVGHQQMMTDPMKPLGLSLWQLTTPRPMAVAGGRLFVDVAPMLASPAGRAVLVERFTRSDPLIGDALRTIVERSFVPALPQDAPGERGATMGEQPPPMEADPAIVAELIAHSRASIAALERDIRGRSGPALVDFILADLGELRRILFGPRSMQVVMAGMDAAEWLTDHLDEWLGEQHAVDTLTQSVPHNVTSEMGLALLDVADAVRPHPDVVALLREAEDERFLDALPALDGGQRAQDAIRDFLDTYGMRCVGEIDVTRPRWRERPTTLVPMILADLRFAPGEAERRRERGRQEARAKEREVLERLRALPDGERKATEAEAMIDRVRTFAGYREYPKYGMVSRYWIYKQALLQEAERLVQAGVLRDREDLLFLTLQEVGEVARTGQVDGERIRERQEAFASSRTLTPPRVFTSDGEVIAGSYRRDDLPAGALVGLPVSAGTVEGRARIVLDAAQADLEAGDILVTPFTDPSWTPLFLAVEGLVTEVGGLMTHGAVIAREYGLPAVVGVQGATRLIRDGQRIRVHGAGGYVELLT